MISHPDLRAAITSWLPALPLLSMTTSRQTAGGIITDSYRSRNSVSCPIPARCMSVEESLITKAIGNIVVEICFGIMTHDSALAQKRIELPSSHLGEDTRLA